MVKRVVVVAAVGIATVFALPTIALGQGEEGSTETSSTNSEPVTEVEGTETEVSATLSEETTTEESTETTTTSDEVEPQTAATTSSSTTTSASTATSSASTQTWLTTAKKSSGKKKKGRKARKSGKRCSASSRGGGQLAQASAPPLPGCVRLNDNEGDLVLPDGTILHITETSQGHISFTVENGPTGTFSGRIYVKGGPSSPGNFCDFNGVTAGTCETFTKNGQNFGVSHVDACPGAFVPPEEDTPEEKSEGKEKQKQVAGGRRKKSPTFVAAGESVTPQGETLPFTGLPVAWLLIVGAGLISGGLAIRRKP